MIDKISEVFDVAPTPSSVSAAVPVVVNTRVEDDSDVARANLRALMQTASVALENAMQVAVQSDSPRAYEVLANLINTAADLNTRLINIHERERKLVTGTSEEDPKVIKQNVTNNVVFSGTTAELNDLIMKRMNNESS